MTVEELIEQKFGVSVEEFIQTHSVIIPSQFGVIVNAIDANDPEKLQEIFDKIDGIAQQVLRKTMHVSKQIRRPK